MYYFSFCFTAFWRIVDNNNRVTERLVGRLKGVVDGLIRDVKDNLSKTDMRILAILHNIVRLKSD